MKLTKETLKELYKLDEIVRYNTHPKHKKETVASHSFYTALFTKMICDEIDATLSTKLLAIEIALVHDIPEIIINDITFDAKELMPDIMPILELNEGRIIKKLFGEMYQHMYQPEGKDKLALAIVRLADTLSVLQFLQYEESMGSKFVQGWEENTLQRIQIAKEQIEREGVSCQKIMI